MLLYHCEQVKRSYNNWLEMRSYELYMQTRDVVSKYALAGPRRCENQSQKTKQPLRLNNKHIAKLAEELAADQGAVDLFINSPSCRDILQTAAQPLLGLPSAVNRERYSLLETITPTSLHPRLFFEQDGSVSSLQFVLLPLPECHSALVKCCE